MSNEEEKTYECPECAIEMTQDEIWLAQDLCGYYIACPSCHTEIERMPELHTEAP